ncbi:MAG TPA: hypothetical protein VK203_03210, partial [Nostocaceae cyanobacterium]|nr:hypothetical protein [Nostocaceae cyanobacterium]
MALPISVNLTKNGRLETASTQARRIAASRREGHLRGFENLDFSLVRVGGLGLYSHEFYSLGLKFT